MPAALVPFSRAMRETRTNYSDFKELISTGRLDKVIEPSSTGYAYVTRESLDRESVARF